MTIRSIALAFVLSLAAFVLGGYVTYNYFFADIDHQINNMSENLLAQKVEVLMFLREGHTEHVEHIVDSRAWSDVVSIGHAAESGKKPSPMAREAIDYQCAQFSKQRASLDEPTVKSRTYFCALLQRP